MCCEDGLTPFCIIRDGEAHGTCRNLSRRASESPDQFVLEVIDIIVEYAGENYRYDASQNITVSDGNVSYESFDGRMQVRATHAARAGQSRRTQADAIIGWRRFAAPTF